MKFHTNHESPQGQEDRVCRCESHSIDSTRHQDCSQRHQEYGYGVQKTAREGLPPVVGSWTHHTRPKSIPVLTRNLLGRSQFLSKPKIPILCNLLATGVVQHDSNQWHQITLVEKIVGQELLCNRALQCHKRFVAFRK